MASIGRTAYPRFRRLVTARELASLTPSEDDVAWAREHTRSDEHLFSLVLALVCFGQLGRFPRAGEVPVAVVEHFRRGLGLSQGTAAWCEARNVKAQRQLVRVASAWSMIRGGRGRSLRLRSARRQRSRTIRRI
jgi:hypothetical protein